ncbi:Uncharacterized protein dnm_031320 [Desulfonema magnum]|uniref:Uncharacterized protein n=1 Tax=Desulfonema magnum TaxID=45655 RepID=A0A975GMW2_9BACT|nr:Uncharacterized protein dnm_031320 [Desulfonema magnum]
MFHVLLWPRDHGHLSKIIKCEQIFVNHQQMKKFKKSKSEIPLQKGIL